MEITHRIVETNGIKMHIAEQGSGPVVLLLHGFPELWYSWRHQIPVLAAAGYHAVAPDMRGYGDTDAPLGAQNYTYFHIVGDLIGLLDALGVEKAFVVGHDWGSVIASHLCLFRPDRVTALVNLSVAHTPRDPTTKPTEKMKTAFGEGYYILRFQKLGAHGSVDRSNNYSPNKIYSWRQRLGIHDTWYEELCSWRGLEEKCSLSRRSSCY